MFQLGSEVTRPTCRTPQATRGALYTKCSVLKAGSASQLELLPLLQRRLDAATKPSNWLAKITGSISDEAAFLEALKYGRALRQADRPADELAEES